MTALVQFRRLVRSRAGVPQHDGLYRPEAIDDAVNQALQDIDTEHRWPWQVQVETVTVTADEPWFDVAESWRATQALLRENRDLLERSAADILRWSTSEQGQPDAFGFVDRRVHVRPVPSSSTSLTHLFYAAPTQLVDDADVPTLPEVYTGVAVAKACELLALREDNRAAAAAHAAAYADGIRRMRKDTRRSTGPIVPRTRPGGWEV